MQESKDFIPGDINNLISTILLALKPVDFLTVSYSKEQVSTEISLLKEEYPQISNQVFEDYTVVLLNTKIGPKLEFVEFLKLYQRDTHDFEKLTEVSENSR